MEKTFRIQGRIREISSDEGQLNFTVDNDMGLTAQIGLSIDRDCKNKAEAFNALYLYENLLVRAEPDIPLGIDFAYDNDYNAEEPWLKQRHYNDDIHHVVQYRFFGVVKNLTTEVTIAGQAANIKNLINGFLGTLRIKGLVLFNDTNGGDVLNFEKD